MGASPAVRCRLEIMLRSSEEAERVHSSVTTDDDGYVKSSVSGSTIIAEIEAQSLMSLLHTIDDYLACMGVAQKIVSGDTSPRPRSSP